MYRSGPPPGGGRQVVGALALWQLNFAREIVYAAFVIGFGAFGVAFALAVGLGAGRALQSGLEALVKKRNGSGPDEPRPSA
ncbi:MAG: hypothetical protein AB7H88_12260 [Vicinamibacterales bacterium]